MSEYNIRYSGQVTTRPSQSLTDADLAVFGRLGIPPEDLLEANVARVTNDEARTEWGIRGSSSMDMSGIIFPYYSLTGQRLTARLRRDNPELKEGKPQNKYISAWGDHKHLYFPPRAAEILSDPDVAIVLVEAEKSALAGMAWARRMGRKFLFVGMGGDWGWHGRIGKRENERGVRVDDKGPISDLDVCNGRQVYIVLDGDAKTNKKIQSARAALVRELKKRGCDTLVGNVPIMDGVNGPDDYIGVAGDEAMAALLDAAVPSANFCEYGGGRFEVSDKGVHYIGPPDKEGRTRQPLWVCSPLTVIAKTRDGKSLEWGRLLEWPDSDMVTHRWAMPMELLQRDGGVEARSVLANQGLAIAPGRLAHESLTSYLSVWPIDVRARCVNRLGWVGTSNGAMYVLPHEAVGAGREQVVFQNAHAIEPAFSTSGTVEEWKGSVAAMAQGNSRLVFAISSAFAGALLEMVGDTSGGFHFCGPSSIGKSTALEVAASVWGEPDRYCRRWRTTVNGLEGLACLHNDGLLILDELSQVDARDAGEAAYLLANGQGKTRTSRNGTARPSMTWRLLFLSAGEESLSALMARAGRKPTVGQEIRLAEIEADAGRSMGLLEELHDLPTPAAMVLAFRDAVRRNHGAVGQQYLRMLTKDRTTGKLAAYLGDNLSQFVKKYVPQETVGGQVERVARRFGLVGLAGRIATIYKLTGWDAETSDAAAATCFRSWLETFGGGNREEQKIIEQVRLFFELHGASRFEDISSEDARVIKRAGFYRKAADGTREFMVLPGVFKQEICAGIPHKFATKVLIEHGLLVPANDGKTSQVSNLPGMGKARVYVFGSQTWESDKNDD